MSLDSANSFTMATDPFLIDLSLAAVSGEEVLGGATLGGKRLYRLAHVYEQMASLLRHGDTDTSRVLKVEVPLLTHHELVRWAALTVAVDNEWSWLDGEPERWSEVVRRRRVAVEQQFITTTRQRVETMTSDLLNKLVLNPQAAGELEATLRDICARLGAGDTEPAVAVAEILRTVITAVGE